MRVTVSGEDSLSKTLIAEINRLKNEVERLQQQLNDMKNGLDLAWLEAPDGKD